MKFRDDFLFAHPVLRPRSDDWQDAFLISGQFDVDLSEESEISIEAAITLSCPELVDLIEEGVAAAGYYMVGRETFQIRLVETGLGMSTQAFPADRFFGTIELRPVIWSKEERHGFTADGLHPEYDGGVDLPAASLLATGEVHRFSVDRERLKPFESIFTLAAADELEPGEIRVNPDSSKIMIVVAPQTKEIVDGMRNSSRGRAVLLASIYVPAVMQVLTELAGSDSYSSQPWHRIFTAKCVAAGVDPAGGNPLEGAQKLLSMPFHQIEKMAEGLFD